MFTAPASSAAAIAELHDLMSPEGEFIRDVCVLEGAVLMSKLYERWQEWCKKTGHRPGSNTEFGRRLRETETSIGKQQRRPKGSPTGKRERWYAGISICTHRNAGCPHRKPEPGEPENIR